MLEKLSIWNYALIDHVELEFSNGFNVITGETGAGKSIIIGALSLILGQRISGKILFDENKKCIIEAQFNINNTQLTHIFEANDWDYEDTCIIRREILPSGKTRSFVNDTPALLDQLQELGKELIDIHSQQAAGIISRISFPYDLLDSYAQIIDLRKNFTTQRRQYRQWEKEWNILNDKIHTEQEQYEYYSHLYDELKTADFHVGEDERLQQEIQKGEHSEKISENILSSYNELYEDDYSVLHKLYEIKQKISELRQLDTTYDQLADRLETVYLELKDISNELASESDNIFMDKDSLEKNSRRLSLLYDLYQKHKVNSINDLLIKQNELEEKIKLIRDKHPRKLEELAEKMNSARTEIEKVSSELHHIRIEKAKELQKRIGDIIRELGMPEAQINILVKPIDTCNDYGKSMVQILFSANKGSTPEPVKKVASGGEKSRLMLAIKHVMATHTLLPSLILDEIDTGISGEVASKAALLMKEMSQSMQLISITHLPQIAARGKLHFKVYKDNSGEKTHSKIKVLSHEERIREIAEMLSGSPPPDTAVAHARKLINLEED